MFSHFVEKGNTLWGGEYGSFVVEAAFPRLAGALAPLTVPFAFFLAVCEPRTSRSGSCPGLPS